MKPPLNPCKVVKKSGKTTIYGAINGINLTKPPFFFPDFGASHVYFKGFTPAEWLHHSLPLFILSGSRNRATPPIESMTNELLETVFGVLCNNNNI